MNKARPRGRSGPVGQDYPIRRWKLFASASGAIGAVLLYLGSVAPDQVQSNLQQWGTLLARLRLPGFPPLRAEAQEVLVWMGAGLLSVAVLIMLAALLTKPTD